MVAQPPPLVPAPPQTAVKRGTPWQRGWVIVGIIFAFPLFLTIPGWLAIREYRRWQRGERGVPVLLIAWGMLGAVLTLIVVLVAIFSG